MTVDEILASGRYTDRRGRRFGRIASPSTYRGEWLQWWPEIRPYPDEVLSPDQMRLLIERDMHRDVCPGLQGCHLEHPSPRVKASYGKYFVYRPFSIFHEEFYENLPGAMDAARALAVTL